MEDLWSETGDKICISNLGRREDRCFFFVGNASGCFFFRPGSIADRRVLGRWPSDVETREALYLNVM